MVMKSEVVCWLYKYSICQQFSAASHIGESSSMDNSWRSTCSSAYP